MALVDGSPRDEKKVVTLDAKRYRVVTRDQAGELGIGPRIWQSQRVSAQDIDPQPFNVPLDSFHEGSGFTYEGLPHTYDYADGWDASSPGKIRTWAKLAEGESVTLTTAPAAGFRGWLAYDAVNHYLYMGRGRYIHKYPVDFSDASWASTQVRDLGSDAWNVAGRPALFDGNWYWPTNDGDDEEWRQITPAGAGSDTDTAGPTGKEARCFTTWLDKLARATGNTVETCSTTPTTSGNWLGSSEIGNSSDPIIDLLVYDRTLLIRTTRGLWTLSQDPSGVIRPVQELPDLADIPDLEGAGGAVSNGRLFIPHKSGLIMWQPQSYMFVGPEQEGALDGSLSYGWGRVVDIAKYGKVFFATHNDPASGTGSLLSYSPPRSQRGPVVPHSHHVVTGSYEGMCVVDNGATDTRTALAVIEVSADGLTAKPVLYELARAGMNPADDPNIEHATSDVAFYTSRIFGPGRSVQKEFRTVEWWMEASPETGTPGFQMWASIDGAAFVQLLDADGVAYTAETTDFHRAYFPASGSVGAYVQLKGLIPALGGGEVAVDITVRECRVRGFIRPLATNAISTVFMLDDTEHPDDAVTRRSSKTQESDLVALYGRDAKAGAIAYKGPDGESGYAEITSLRIQEAYWRKEERPVKLAFVELLVGERY